MYTTMTPPVKFSPAARATFERLLTRLRERYDELTNTRPRDADEQERHHVRAVALCRHRQQATNLAVECTSDAELLSRCAAVAAAAGLKDFAQGD